MITLKDIQQARALLKNFSVRTPLVTCKLPGGKSIFVKPENLQPIGSFKLRGAYNKISSLTPAAIMLRAWLMRPKRWE